jgi:hypothetical protein
MINSVQRIAQRLLHKNVSTLISELLGSRNMKRRWITNEHDRRSDGERVLQ